VQGSEFARDPKTRTLTVSSYERGGNVQYEDYGFRRGKWGLLRQIDHDQKSSPFIVDTEARFKNGKEYRGSKTISLYGDREARFGFRLLGRDKELLMVEGGDGTLYYAFGKRGKGEEHDYLMVELAFPEPGGGQGRGRGDFFALQRDAGRLRLSFARGDAKYEVFQEAGGGAGVRVEQKGKVKEWKADPGTIRGSLEFPEGLPVNVRVR
jgi:hypothetical protein